MASDDSEATHHPHRAPLPPMAADLAVLPNNSLAPLTLRLDRTNYSYWRALVLAATRAYNLDGFLLGTSTPPPIVLDGNRSNPAYQIWHCYDQFLVH